MAGRGLKIVEQLANITNERANAMPFCLHPSRRAFLAASTSTLLTLSTRASSAAESPVDDNLVYLLNDTHIGEKQPADSSVPTHLTQAISEIVSLPKRPAAVIINGDLALRDGQPGDYVHFAKLIAPLQSANIETHLTLGNHDNRDAFYGVMQDQRPETSLVESRHVAVVQTNHANFFLLDSLQDTMVTQGIVGAQQLRWLEAALDRHSDRPAIIVAHHNPRLGGDPVHFPGGLIDSRELWNSLVPREHVKAYVHGHVHDRAYSIHQKIHVLNLPATSYVGNEELSTTGWTTARLNASTIELTTHTTNPEHPWNGDQQTLLWRK